MADLGSIEANMQNVEKALGEYTGNLPSEIMSEVQKAWTPALKGAVGATQNLMGQALPTFFTAAEALGGTTAADLSPTQKLGQMGNILGNWQGRIYATQKVSDYLGGQMNDMYNRAIQAMQLGYNQLADKYSRIAQQYQMAWQEAENQKDRDLQIKLKGMSGGGGGGGGLPGWGWATAEEAPSAQEQATQRLGGAISAAVSRLGPREPREAAKSIGGAVGSAAQNIFNRRSKYGGSGW